MLSRALSRLSAALDPGVSSGDVDVRKLDIERVSAMLLVEIARADHDVDTSEQQAIEAALQVASTLDEQEVRDLVTEAMAEADASLSLHEHISIINSQLAKADKLALVEQMWRVAAADGDIDRFEEYTIRKLCDLIYIKHRDFMQAKHRVLDGS